MALAARPPYRTAAVRFHRPSYRRLALTVALAPSFAPAFADANPKTQLRRSAAQDSGAFLRLFLRCLLL
ncbi:hypothetical protein HOO65_050702 [Ceratocystis lukuohia]|uniref:Uncharacterized protein n=1 Tax=Ceratocystis lukuohia TaxID=2019550 RepID=A0ABR4MH21_9PEZI